MDVHVNCSAVPIPILYNQGMLSLSSGGIAYPDPYFQSTLNAETASAFNAETASVLHLNPGRAIRPLLPSVCQITHYASDLIHICKGFGLPRFRCSPAGSAIYVPHRPEFWHQFSAAPRYCVQSDAMPC